VINDRSKQTAIARHGFSSNHVQVAEPGIDLDRFSPQRKITADHHRFGLSPNSFVVGVVSRIRDGRRLDITLKAIHKLAEAYPQLQMLLVGRGRKGAVEQVVEKPAREMDISDKIVMAGYCDGDHLVAAYRAMDVLVYAIPGADKSCRTVREAMASGLPVIAPPIGFLSELVEDHVTGRLMDLSGERLAKILEELLRDQNKLREMGRRSIQRANQRFSLGLQAKKTLSFYRKLLESRQM
jgi:glycosyltransferase involved in cell wall biosynthesis